MGYHLNFGAVWRDFDLLLSGLGLGLGLAIVVHLHRMLDRPGGGLCA